RRDGLPSALSRAGGGYLTSEPLSAIEAPSPGGGSPPLAKLAMTGFRWNTLSLVLTAVAQIGYTAVTARALPPRAFGLYAVSQALMSVAGYFSLVSLGNAVMRHPGEQREEDLASSALALAAIAGSLTAAVTAALAPVWVDLW